MAGAGAAMLAAHKSYELKGTYDRIAGPLANCLEKESNVYASEQ